MRRRNHSMQALHQGVKDLTRYGGLLDHTSREAADKTLLYFGGLNEEIR